MRLALDSARLADMEYCVRLFPPIPQDGGWQNIHDALHAQLRRRQGREESPSAAIIDSQSVKTTEKGASRI